jgi:hypothetical protein
MKRAMIVGLTGCALPFVLAAPLPAGTRFALPSAEWKLDDKGYCTTWKSCFTVIPNGTNKWSVMKGSVVMATWSK